MVEKLEQKVPEEPTSSSELIGLEYVVKFDDGLKPTFCVYGIDSQTKNVYGAHAYLGIQIGTGFRPVVTDGEFILDRVVLMGVKAVVQEFEVVPKGDNHEEVVKQKCQEQKINLIRVKNREHIKPAISRHAELYTDQFKTFGLEIAKSFDAFMEQHQGYLGLERISDVPEGNLESPQ